MREADPRACCTWPCLSAPTRCRWLTRPRATLTQGAAAVLLAVLRARRHIHSAPALCGARARRARAAGGAAGRAADDAALRRRRLGVRRGLRVRRRVCARGYYRVQRASSSTGALPQAEARHAGHVGCQVSTPAVAGTGRPHHPERGALARRQQRLQARQRGGREAQVEVQRRRAVQPVRLRSAAHTLAW